MRSMYLQLGILEIISVFAYRQKETKKNRCYEELIKHLMFV